MFVGWPDADDKPRLVVRFCRSHDPAGGSPRGAIFGAIFGAPKFAPRGDLIGALPFRSAPFSYYGSSHHLAFLSLCPPPVFSTA